MKILRPILIGIIICLSSMYVNGQTEKGKFMIGGASYFELNSSSYEGGESVTSLHFAPQVSYFIIRGLSIGMQFPLNHTFSKDNSTTYFLCSPTIRYYFGKKNTKPFVQVAQSLIGTYRYHIYSSDGKERIKQKLTLFEMYGGLSFFLNHTVSIELSLGYEVYSTRNLNYESSKNKSSAFKLGVGFSIFL